MSKMKTNPITSMPRRVGSAARVTTRLLEARLHAALSASEARTTISKSSSTRPTRGNERGRLGLAPATTAAPYSTLTTLAIAGQRTTFKSASTKCSRPSRSARREPCSPGCTTSRTSLLCRSSLGTRSTFHFHTRGCEESPRDRKLARINREINRDRMPGNRRA
jgi:hypothetical protein